MARMSMTKAKTAERALPRLMQSFEKCGLCLHRCGVNRIKGEKGLCGAPAEAAVYSYHPHQGEEPPISGKMGSGTIFFSYCSLNCAYCQNWRFSQKGEGKITRPAKLAEIMLKLRDDGCHNINLVSPTHFVPPIAEAMALAFRKGLDIPVVYNTAGYDSPETIKFLDGVVDIYLPDMRYSDDANAIKYSMANGYTANNREIVREMARQVGALNLTPSDIATKGLIIRLLILPNGISGTENTLEFIAHEMGGDTFLSVMSQYYPAYKAKNIQELSGGIRGADYRNVVKKMDELGLHKGWLQPSGGKFDTRLKGENFRSTFT